MKKINILISIIILLTMISFLGACGSTSENQSTGEYIDDSVITTKVKSLLAGDDYLNSYQISVETRKGIVQLSGFVDSKTAMTDAGKIAKEVAGVSSVENDLIVK